MIEEHGNQAAGNQSAEKALRILEYLTEQNEPMRLTDIARGLSINSSTALRFLTTLTAMGYVDQEKDTSKYYLTYKLIAMGHKAGEHKQLSRIIAPYLRELSETLHESICLAIDQNHQVVYVDVAEGPGQIVKAMQRIGNIAPLHCTGIGKLLLLNYTDAQLDDLIRERGLTKYTENTLITKEALLCELNETRNRGFAFDNEECEIGARCIAFPVYDYTQKIIAGISVTGPAIRITDEFAARWVPYLKQTAQQVSRQFGWGQYIPSK